VTKVRVRAVGLDHRIATMWHHPLRLLRCEVFRGRGEVTPRGILDEEVFRLRKFQDAIVPSVRSGHDVDGDRYLRIRVLRQIVC